MPPEISEIFTTHLVAAVPLTDTKIYQFDSKDIKGPCVALKKTKGVVCVWSLIKVKITVVAAEHFTGCRLPTLAQ